jgi:CBS domain-containing protein/gamma-glutamylcysteine synthetase
MGIHDVGDKPTGEPWRLFQKRLLDDLYALEKMLEDGLVESQGRRIGAEQELFLVDAGGRPQPAAMEVLGDLDDEHFATELARFNLEINLDPLPFTGSALGDMERQLNLLLNKVRQAAAGHGADVVLAGILPSLRKSDMGQHNMTPLPRYAALDKATSALRGKPMQYRIKGVDELSLVHDSLMLEACNASFQVHLQASPDGFDRLYNAAQAFAAPVLAAAVNSPLLFGQRLWQETRIALFQQAVDYRNQDRALRQSPSRVSFGEGWARGPVTNIFKQDITRFRVIMGQELDEDPFALLEEGRIPTLQALRLHNSTIWHWNRACYGVTEGRPTLRIENRTLPAGPTPRDEVANAAFWLGLMASAEKDGTDFADRMEFGDAKENFIAAARNGLAAQFKWPGGRTLPAQELVRNELLPLAREGLAAAGIDRADADTYLDVVGERVDSGRTGAHWLTSSLAAMNSAGTASERFSALSRGLVTRQMEGAPVATWEPAVMAEAGGWKQHYVRVEQYMTTNLFTVHQEDTVDLVANMMDWENIRHVPVEDDQHHLVGLVSSRSLLRMLAKGRRGQDMTALPVAEIMRTDIITVAPETATVEAIEMMRRHEVGCLPVVKEGCLVGILTERDFMVITRELLCEKLKD